MKGLDQTVTVVPVKAPPKDVNTFKNNQVKFSAGAGTIPQDQIKCNILKAKRDEEIKKTNDGIVLRYSVVNFVKNMHKRAVIIKSATLTT